MRLAEFLALNQEDIDPITGTILIRSGRVESRAMPIWVTNRARFFEGISRREQTTTLLYG